MHIKAYPLYDHAVPLQPAAPTPTETTTDLVHVATAARSDINQPGWQLLCPQGFTATWNGGPNPEDIQIHWAAASPEEEGAAEDKSGPHPFVQSQLGEGRLTFYPGYQCKTEEGYLLWVRGPINAAKAGLTPLESLLDAALLPCTVVMHWQFTQPNQTVHFAAGEPFATILPWAKSDLEKVTLEVVYANAPGAAADQADEDQADEAAERALAAYEQAFQQLADNAAVNGVFQRLAALTPANAPPASAPPRPWASQLTDPPAVSCICPTYGRVALLEEAIESFLRQDYPGRKELIVLNDYGEQTLLFDHPEVKVINLPQRVATLGEKYNMAVELAAHDLIFVWHDDDIYLPHRLSYTVAQMEAEKDFFKADKAWCWNNGQWSGPDKNSFHGGSCWRRPLFRQAQGYPAVDPMYDVEFEQRCRVAAPHRRQVKVIKPADIYYLYRWAGTGSYHHSVISSTGEESQRIVEYVADQAKRGAISLGQIPLLPHWRSDYAVLAQEYWAALPEAKQEVPDEIPFPPPYIFIPPPPALEPTVAAQLFGADYPRRISVILPASNESVLLQRTVEQFVATLPANSEVIVVDNGSSDGCADFLLAQPYAQHPQINVQLIQTAAALGVAGARNRGLAAAQGEIVVFADAHIDVPEHWWQPFVSLLQQPHVGVVGPGIGIMGHPGIHASHGQRISNAKMQLKWLPKAQDEPYVVPALGGGFMVMRHDTLKIAGAFDAGMPQWGSEDMELCVRYWLLGYEVWVVPSVTVLHYFRNASPYTVEWKLVTHNVLRVALLHFNQTRLSRVLAALKGDGRFEQALAHAVESDVWQKRAAFAARRVRDDDWFLAKFADSCQV